MPESSKRTGFTLIKLLVVIAIIAILAAILFPVFAKAREKARQTTCASDTKQLALGFVQYVQDYDERFPLAYTAITATPPNGYYWPKIIYPYVKSTGVFKCPDDSGDGDLQASLSAEPNAGQPAFTDYALESYGMNLALNNFIRSYSGITLAQINNPAELCLIAENATALVAGQSYGAYFAGVGQPGGNFVSAQYNTGQANVWYSGTDGSGGTPVQGDYPYADHAYNSSFATPIARHSGGTNVGYSDGHVKWVTFNNLYNPPAGVTHPNFRLWHPDA